MSLACIIGGGRSAAKQELHNLRAFTVALNEAAFRVEGVDVIFTADGSWLKRAALRLHDVGEIRIVAALPDGREAPDIPRLEIIRRIKGVGISDNPQEVFFGDNSGFAALNWLIASGFKRIALVGFDMKGGWWHAGYNYKRKIPTFVQYNSWISAFDAVAQEIGKRGIDVVNTNPDSALRCFRFGKLEDQWTQPLAL